MIADSTICAICVRPKTRLTAIMCSMTGEEGFRVYVLCTSTVYVHNDARANISNYLTEFYYFFAFIYILNICTSFHKLVSLW